MILATIAIIVIRNNMTWCVIPMLSACAHCHHFWWDWRMGHAFFQTVYKILLTIQHTLVAYSLSSWCILGSQHFHRVSRLVSFLWLLVSILISHLCSCFPVLGQKILLVSHLCLHLFPDWWPPSIIHVASRRQLPAPHRWAAARNCQWCRPLRPKTSESTDCRKKNREEFDSHV